MMLIGTVREVITGCMLLFDLLRLLSCGLGSAIYGRFPLAFQIPTQNIKSRWLHSQEVGVESSVRSIQLSQT